MSRARATSMSITASLSATRDARMGVREGIDIRHGGPLFSGGAGRHPARVGSLGMITRVVLVLRPCRRSRAAVSPSAARMSYSWRRRPGRSAGRTRRRGPPAADQVLSCPGEVRDHVMNAPSRRRRDRRVVAPGWVVTRDVIRSRAPRYSSESCALSLTPPTLAAVGGHFVSRLSSGSSSLRSGT